jgi:hypothetical protein
MSAKSTLLHGVDDGLHVASAERQVVGHRSGAVRVEIDRGGRGATGRLDAKLRELELQIRFDVKVLSGVILKRFVDDRRYLVLSEGEQLAGIWNRVAGFENRQLMLKDREACFGDWGPFV